MGQDSPLESQDVEAEEPVNIEPAPVATRANKAPTTLDAAVPQDLNPQLDQNPGW